MGREPARLIRVPGKRSVVVSQLRHKLKDWSIQLGRSCKGKVLHVLRLLQGRKVPVYMRPIYGGEVEDFIKSLAGETEILNYNEGLTEIGKAIADNAEFTQFIINQYNNIVTYQDQFKQDESSRRATIVLNVWINGFQMGRLMEQRFGENRELERMASGGDRK